jgi:ribosomal protein S2
LLKLSLGASCVQDRETKKTKYMFLSPHQNAGQSYNIKIPNRCFENVAQFRYLGTTITNQNLIQEEIKEVELG